MRQFVHRPLVVVTIAIALTGAGAGAVSAQDPLAGANGELVAVNGTELYVHRKGEGRGPAIVVVHGGPVLEHGYLLPWLSPLADDHEVVFYDQRLSGRSAATTPPEAVRVATFVDDIEALRRQLGLERIHLLAHSWGAHLALRYAIEHGANLESLVLLDAMAASVELWQREEAVLAERMSDGQREEIQRLRGAEGVAAGDPAAIGALLLASFRTQFHDPELADRLELYVPPDYLSRSRQFGAMAADLSDFDLHPQLRTLTVPTLLVYGAAEPGLEHGGRALAEAIPGARLEVIPEAGHFPFIEQPEPFLSRVRAFLAEVSER